LTYKKIANKVLLAKEEIDELQQDFVALHQENSTEVVSQSSGVTTINPSIEKMVEEKIDKFMLIVTEKDKQIEDKNKVIFMLQQRV
jgi:2-hydroxy-3-keto-5-methylthiopentenyl-1-phosphate phosphatase